MTARLGRNYLPRQNGRFEAIGDVLDSVNPRVLSFDVFDTLLWRRVPKPTDAHLLLGRNLADEGVLKPHVDPRIFARLRILAEEEARNRKSRLAGTSEVTLAEIYAVLTPGVTDRLSVSDMVAREVENERSLTFPDAALVAYIQANRDRYERLVAVSDTYLSEEEIRSLFARHGIDDLGFSAIYTSSERGTGKGARLWEHVVQDLAEAPGAIVHVGDNYEADVTAAQRVGVVGIHLPMNTNRFFEVGIRERIAGDVGEPSHWCDERWGDGGLTAVRRRATLLPAPDGISSPDEQVTWETGTAVLGPVFTGFAQWVHEQAAAIGAERALCVMREGRFLKRLLDGAEPVPSRQLAIHTVWASREACARASIYEGTEAELRTFLNRVKTPPPGQLASSLGLDPTDLPEFSALLRSFDESRVDEREAGESIIDLVLTRDDLLQAVLARSRSRRQRLVAHLREAAGPGPGPIALVDVGWAGTILESLQRMLEAEGDDLALHGFYLLAHIGSASRVLRGIALQGYLGDSGSIPFDIAGITGNPELAELACMCDEGSFLEMGSNGDPVLAPKAPTPLESERRALLQDGIVTFQSEWLRQRDPHALFETSPEARSALRRILERFVSQPDQQEAASFSWWGHEENLGSGNVERLVPLSLLPTLPYRTAESLHDAAAEELYWVGGAAALVDSETADSVLLMRRGAAIPGRFSSASDAGAAGISLTLSDGTEIPVGEIPILVNRQALSVVEWTGDLRSAAIVHIRPAEHSAVLRLDRLEIVSTDRWGSVVWKRTWSPTSDSGGIEVRRATALGDGTYVVDGRTRFDLATPHSRDALSLQITMAGAYLPIPDTRGPEGWASPDAADELAALRTEVAALHQTKLFRAAAVPRQIYGRLRNRTRRSSS